MQYSKQDLEKILRELIAEAIERSTNQDTAKEIVELLKNNYLLVSKILDDSFTVGSRLRTSNLLHGVGFMDLPITAEVKGAYETWRHMIRRSYANEYKNRKHTYDECIVNEEWFTFSEFLKFYQEHYRPGFHLDKDILVAGNKIYSKDTCCFVPPAINGLIVNIGSSGVSFDKNKKKYRAGISIKGKQKNLGNYNTIEEAEGVYKIAKRKYVEDIATEYFDKGDISSAIADALKARVMDW
jgi:hypothetical protein